jgi:sterol desaturase/sphingolipid hydroxylase (fatty acid hydroxylase superfamily)
MEWARRFLSDSLLMTWFAMFAVGTVAEYLFMAEAGQSWRARLLNVRYSVLYALALFVLGPFVFLATSKIAAQLGLGWIDLTWLSGSSIAAQIGIGLLATSLSDFFYYWQHRAQHTIPWLWDQHAVHHSDEALNVTTGTRHHWSEFILQSFLVALPLSVVFRLPSVTLWTVATLLAAWGFFIHSNLRIQLGRFSALLCGPQVHRIHHSRLPEHADKNFAAYFPLWDVLFGTYWHPRAHEFPPTGLSSGEKMETVTELATWPFVQWARRVKAGFGRLRARDAL